MPKAICENCGSLVEAELTHNGVCVVGHYVHCGWGHELSPDDLISGDVADRIEELEAKLAKALGALELLHSNLVHAWPSVADLGPVANARTTLAELKGGKDD